MRLLLFLRFSMKFLLKAISILSARLGRSLLAQIGEFVTPEVLEYINQNARRALLALAVRFIFVSLFIAGFLMAFTEAMRQLDSIGTLEGSAMLLGNIALSLFSALFFWAFGHRRRVSRSQATTNVPVLSNAAEEELDDGLTVLMRELREERHQFHENRIVKHQ